MFASFRSLVSRFENKENEFTVRRKDFDAGCVNSGLAWLLIPTTFLYVSPANSVFERQFWIPQITSSINCMLHCETREIYWNSSVPRNFHFGLERERNVSSRLHKAKTKSCLNLFLIFIDRPEEESRERNDHNFHLPEKICCFRWGSLATTRRWERSLLLYTSPFSPVSS